MVALGAEADIVNTAESLYHDLGAGGYEILYDNRDESAGVKFNDADLIGIPIRLTVGSRSLSAGGVEIKRRSAAKADVVPLQGIEATLQELVH